MKFSFEAIMLTANLSKRKFCKLLGKRREMTVALNMSWLGSGTRKGLEYGK